MDFKRWTLLTLMIGALLVTAFANDRDEITEDRRARFDERRAYFQENIKPVIDAQRNKLDESISDADKKEVVRLREELISQLLIQNEFMYEARAARIKGEPVDESLRDEMKAQRIVIENIFDEAKVLANKYRPEIDDLLAEIKENRSEWREEMKAERGERMGKGHGRHHGHRDGGEIGPMGRGFGPGNRGGLGIATFLLWDVNRG